LYSNSIKLVFTFVTQNRTPVTNMRLAQWRVTWLIEHATSHQVLWCIDSFVLRNPPLRQAPKRYYPAHPLPVRIEPM
jgi:hypothetical protein